MAITPPHKYNMEHMFRAEIEIRFIMNLFGGKNNNFSGARDSFDLYN
jgi:hypothetical protein